MSKYDSEATVQNNVFDVLPQKVGGRLSFTWLREYTLLVILLCTLIDATAVFTFLVAKNNFVKATTNKSIDDLEIRSSYSRLDRLWKMKGFPKAKHDRILNNARAIYQISSAAPTKNLPVYTDMRLANVGVAPVYFRRLMVDNIVRIFSQNIATSDFIRRPLPCSNFG